MNDNIQYLVPQASPLILLIDEQADRLQSMARILGPAGYRLSVAMSGYDARSRVQLISPDLIIMDEEMLQKARFEAGGRLYITDQAVSTPVILMVDRLSAAACEQAFELGAADYAGKPLNPQELISKTAVQILLRRAQASERSLREELQVARELIDMMSVTDSLTSLFNHRGFITLSEQQLKICKRQAKPALLAYMDIDGLQRVNEQFGHLVGDQLLIDVSTIIRKAFRDSDIIARMGGDEFAVFLVDSEEKTAGLLTERLAMHTERFNSSMARDYKISLSMGIVPCTPEASPSIEELLTMASALMKRNKKSGD